MSKTRESQRHAAKCVTGQNVRPRGLLVEHGEKLLFAVFGVVVLWCLLAAIGRESYPRTPEQLASSLEQKRSALAQNTPQTFPLLNPMIVEKFGERARPRPVSAGDRRPLLGWPRWPEDFKFRRGAPTLLPPADVRADRIDEAVAVGMADVMKRPRGGPAAPMGVAPPAAPGAPGPAAEAAAKVESRGLIGVLVTARIPREEQIACFRKAFADTRAYEVKRDTPGYVSFVLQRSQDGGKTWGDIVTVKTKAGPRQMTLSEASAEIAKTFHGAAEEIVDAAQGDFMVPGFAAPLPPILGRNWDARAAGGFPVRRPGDRPAPALPGGAPGAPPAAAPPGGPADQGPPNAAAGVPRDFLFRFFDFAVEEGRTYRYRVAVVLGNPNFDLPRALLSDASLSTASELTSPFSKPTQEVRVSSAPAEVVAGPVRGGRAELALPESATVILRQRHRPTGSIIAHTFRGLESGQVLNFRAANVKYEKALGGVETTPLTDFDFRSNELLVDLKGAAERARPGELLLLDQSGRLVVRTEVPGSANSRDALAASAVTFASETKRLEATYNYDPAANAVVMGAGQELGGLLPAPKKVEKKEPSGR